MVGTDPEDDDAVFKGSAPDRGLTVGLGDAGRWLVVTERDPGTGGTRVLIANRGAATYSFRALVDDASASYRFVGGQGDRLWFETDRDAPNRKVVAVNLSTPGTSASAVGTTSGELQHAQHCDNPIMLRVTWGAGHSSGATVDDAVDTWTDQLAFVARVLGIRLTPN